MITTDNLPPLPAFDDAAAFNAPAVREMMLDYALAALATQPSREAVAHRWLFTDEHGLEGVTSLAPSQWNARSRNSRTAVTPLYTQPPSEPASPDVAAQGLKELIGSFEAAFVEGLTEALAETSDARLKDLVERRLLVGYENALAAPKALTPDAEDLNIHPDDMPEYRARSALAALAHPVAPKGVDFGDDAYRRATPPASAAQGAGGAEVETGFVRLSKSSDHGKPYRAWEHAKEQARKELAPAIAALIVRDVCETDPADPQDPNTVCVNVDVLGQIVTDNLPAPAPEHVKAVTPAAKPDLERAYHACTTAAETPPSLVGFDRFIDGVRWAESRYSAATHPRPSDADVRDAPWLDEPSTNELRRHLCERLESFKLGVLLDIDAAIAATQQAATPPAAQGKPEAGSV